MKKSFLMMTMVAFIAFASGCASIVGQSMFPVTINSNPDGASVKIIDDKGLSVFHGITPTTVTLQSGESYFHAKTYSLTFSKPGFSDQHAVLRAELSGWYFGNILFGGLIGALIVDPITGKMWKLPTSYTANLEGQSSKNSVKELQILTLDQVPQDLRKELVSIN